MREIMLGNQKVRFHRRGCHGAHLREAASTSDSNPQPKVLNIPSFSRGWVGRWTPGQETMATEET